jgi:Tfp pilus assembly protein PilV
MNNNMFSAFKTKINKGFSLVEVLVGASIIVVAIFALMNAYGSFLRAEASSSKGLEAARFMRDSSYTNFVSTVGTSTPKYLMIVASSTPDYYVWQATSTVKIEDSLFTRTIKLEDVKRDASTQNIVSNSGVNDVNTKKITVSVSWLNPVGTTSIKSLSTYLTNLYAN